MVQTATQAGKKLRTGNLETRYRTIVREVHSLPPAMLTSLLHEIADAMGGHAASSNGSTAQAVMNGHRDSRNGGNGAVSLAHDVRVDSNEDEESERPSGYDLLIAGVGPMAEVARMLKRGNLTDAERQRMKEMA